MYWRRIIRQPRGSGDVGNQVGGGWAGTRNLSGQISSMSRGACWDVLVPPHVQAVATRKKAKLFLLLSGTHSRFKVPGGSIWWLKSRCYAPALESKTHTMVYFPNIGRSFRCQVAKKGIYKQQQHECPRMFIWELLNPFSWMCFIYFYTFLFYNQHM